MSLPAAKPAGAPVAPLNDALVPENLRDLYRAARTSAVSRELVDWVFREAKAIGMREVALVEIKRLDTDFAAISYQAAGKDTVVAAELVYHHGPHPERVQRANTRYQDALEQVAACGRMIELLKQERTAPNGKTPADINRR